MRRVVSVPSAAVHQPQPAAADQLAPPPAWPMLRAKPPAAGAGSFAATVAASATALAAPPRPAVDATKNEKGG